MDDLLLWREFRRFYIHDHRGSKHAPCNVPKKPTHGRGYFLILECLKKNDGMLQRKLADSVEIRAQTLSEALCGMEEKGLIRREDDPEDRRAIRVFLTEEGEKYCVEREKDLRRRAEERFRPLSEKEKETLYQILQKLHVEKE